MKSLHVGLWMMMLVFQNSYGASFSLSGNVISDNQKMMTSRYMGFVKEVHFSEGDMVKKGDLLYVIDSKEIDSALAQSDLAIAQAELLEQMHQSQYQNAQLNLARHQRLYAKDMVSKFEVENLELSTRNLEASVKIAHKQLLQAKHKKEEVLASYTYLKITAPNDGVIVAKHIKAGEMAMPGVTSLVLSDLSDLKIVSEISESNLKDIAIGASVSLEIASIGFKGKGIIESIIPSANPTAHTFSIKIKFDKKEAMVYPGMYVMVLFGAH